MSRLHLDNAIAFRKDQRVLYFKDKDGWKPIQVITELVSDKEQNLDQLVMVHLMTLSSRSSSSSPPKKSQTGLVCVETGRFRPSTEKNVTMETTSSLTLVSVSNIYVHVHTCKHGKHHFSFSPKLTHLFIYNVYFIYFIMIMTKMILIT